MIIVKLYVTLLSSIFAGIVNSIFCKSNAFSCLKKPIDNNIVLKDGNRMFGENKTWKGFLGYIVFNILFAVLFGFVWSCFDLEDLNFFYYNYDNTILYNVLIGFLLGLFYALFELPNSFLKRRLGIKPGKETKGLLRYFFIFLDQADSIFGMALVVLMFSPISLCTYFLFVLVGSITHILINMMLYFMKLRKNMF